MDPIEIDHALGDFVERVREFKPEDIDVPEFYIAGWPNCVGKVEVVVSYLGRIKRVKKLEGGMVRLYKRLCLGFFGFTFSILEGSIEIRSFRRSYHSTYGYYSSGFKRSVVGVDKIEKANALLLFDQLKNKALPQIIKKVEQDVRYNNEAVEEVRKALEPFLPQIMADEFEK